MSGSAECRNRCREAPLRADIQNCSLRVLTSVPSTPVPPLTNDLHGCRLYGNYPAIGKGGSGQHRRGTWTGLRPGAADGGRVKDWHCDAELIDYKKLRLEFGANVGADPPV